ncbi:polysaccharide lyase family 7 protein [Neolewinella persica]|uniref:polysaccharide lyase family 7 protein n=1 Tax=Neolewinella persica TaxID=70998 RepID=UPI0003811D1C|nr:polysaccharide lyase family 7 protein [Neolewinella persica]
MKAPSNYRFLGFELKGCFFKPFYSRCILLFFALTTFSYSATAQDLDPNLPPSGNFDLSYWKLTRPNQQEIGEDNLSNGFVRDGEFYTDPITGAMVFWCPNNGSTGGSTYPRNELREMIRAGNTSIATQGINGNNWVFSSSSMANQEAAGGVDGVMTATVAVDYVSETSDESRKIGRVIVGQIHASNDEPCRIYYRKLPGNTKGSIYFAHEPTTGAEQWYEMIGSRADGASDPEDGIALGEKFSYEIKVVFNTLTVTIMREGKPDVVQEVDMTNSGFADDWMYFKAGNYNQNNAGDPDEYAQVSFFALDVSHSGPVPPTGYDAPTDIPRFQPFLAECKLQAPNSSTLRAQDALDGYTHPDWFYVVDGDKIRFNQTGESMRTELRYEENYDVNEANRSMHARLDIAEQTCEQVTVLQIHDDANAGPGPNKPLLRIYKHQGRIPTNHLWAAIKTDAAGINTTHVDLGEDPGGYFTCAIRLVDGRMIIDYQGEEKANVDVSFWTYPSYWKAGVYLQDNGEATAHFDELFEGDGSPQNYVPSVSITSPANGTNFTPGSDVDISVDATDSDGTITKVEFFEGNTLLGEDATAPYSFTWSGAAEGAYSLTAKATDNEGGARTTLSTEITISEQVDVTGVDLVGSSSAVIVGSFLQLEAVVSPANATNQNVVFISDDPNIATVDENGLLTGVSEGVVTVTVTTAEGGFVDSGLVYVVTPSTEFNWALNQPIAGTGTPDGANTPDKLVDDNTNSRWSVQDFPQSATVDLWQDITITQIEVTCHESRAYQFIVEGALTADGPFTTIVDRSNNTTPGAPTAPIINIVDSIEARFVRITVLGADVYMGPWVSLTELRVFGEGDERIVNTTEPLLNPMQLIPNPATSIVTINGAEEYQTVSVYDQTGRIVIHRSIDNETSLDVSGLKAGMYFIKLEGNSRPQVSKLIKH